MNPLVSLFCDSNVCGGRLERTHTHTQTKYYNPLCACAPRVKYNTGGHEAIMFFFGPLCYSPMLQTMSDYALEIFRLFFFIKINFTKQLTRYHSFSRISTIIITSKKILCSLGANCPAAPQHIYMCTYHSTYFS